MSFRSHRRPLAAIGALLLVAAAVFAAFGTVAAPRGVPARAQELPTPVPLQFPTPTPTAGPPSETPTRTPTSAGRPVVEAISNNTNVRAGPDLTANLVAQIFPGTTYPVLGRRFQWYWIEFPDTPAGTAWVHESVVRLSGDATLIQDIELQDIPTLDPAIAAAQETAQAISATPGAAATLTAQAQITPTGVFTPAPGDQGATLVPGAPLPTFTFPPYTVTPVLIPRTNPTSTAEATGIPPLVPILALAALGLMGMLVAFMRRL